MSELTEQTVFDTVVEHFKKQKVRAVDEQGACVYKAPDGLKCAVGILLTDEDNPLKLNGYGSVPNLIAVGLLPERLLPFAGGEDEEIEFPESLLCRLQVIHDVTAQFESDGLVSKPVGEALKKLAKDFKLDDSKVDWV